MKPIIIANWKMNETASAAEILVDDIITDLGDDVSKAEVVVCPPFTALEAIHKSKIKKGAQDIHWEDKGTYTGEISGPMLKDLDCEYVLIGHSERRWKLNENDEVINRKLLAAIRNNLIPILCVGERENDKKENRTELVLKNQLEKAWREIGADDFTEAIIAYEPVWAIGTGEVGSKEAATAENVSLAYEIIEKFCVAQNISNKVKLVYGGSVDASNVSEFSSLENNSGFLVGSASLKSDEFVKIVKNVIS